MSPHHYVRIPHCALCGQRFDRISSFNSVIIRDSPDRDILVTQSLSFHRDSHTIYLEDLGVHIHDYGRKKARYAPSVHSLCKTAGMNLPSPHIIHNLGLAMIPLVMTGLPQEFYRINALSEAVDSLLETSQDIEGGSMLWKLLRRFRELPPELTIIIWDFLASGPVRCLLALNSSKKIWSHAPLSAGKATISLSGEIVVYFTHLTKDEYVCGIRQGHILYGHESSSFTNVQIPTSNATFVFSLGIYGLQKFEFLTETGTSPTSETDSDGRRFISVIPYQRDLPVRVDIEWDVLKISLITPHNKSVFGNNFIWVPPVPCSHLRWLSPKRFYDWPRHSDFAIQPQRFMAYIPLKRDKRLYGITAFCSSEGFVGLGTHFCSYSYPDFRKQDASVYWYGKQQGYPIHIQLDYSDDISSVYVYWHQSDALSGSYLAVRTIRNRIFILGPQFPPSKTAMRNIFESDDGDILGLYYDASPGITGFTSLGTVCRPNEYSKSHDLDHAITQILPNSDMIWFLDTSPFTSFSSQACLNDIEMIEACYIDSRCTGLLLCYNNSRRCILGQWYEKTHIQPDIRPISLQKDGFLRFYFAYSGHTQLVTHVKALTSAASGETGVIFVDVAYGDEIVWMFSGNSDIIMYSS